MDFIDVKEKHSNWLSGDVNSPESITFDGFLNIDINSGNIMVNGNEIACPAFCPEVIDLVFTELSYRSTHLLMNDPNTRVNGSYFGISTGNGSTGVPKDEYAIIFWSAEYQRWMYSGGEFENDIFKPVAVIPSSKIVATSDYADANMMMSFYAGIATGMNQVVESLEFSNGLEEANIKMISSITLSNIYAALADKNPPRSYYESGRIVTN